MEKELEDTINKGKIWGLRIVAVITVIGTVYSSVKPEDEAREYYNIVQPAIEEAVSVSLSTEELALMNQNDISELRGIILGMQSCNTVSTDTPPENKKSKKKPSVQNPSHHNHKKVNHRKVYLPKTPWSKLLK